MLELPKEEYTTEVRNGKTYHVCTLRQMVLHTIGLGDYRQPYTRHGRKFYRPYRNHPLVEAGYMTEDAMPRAPDRTEGYLYRLTRAGLDWLGEQIGVTIHDEE